MAAEAGVSAWRRKRGYVKLDCAIAGEIQTGIFIFNLEGLAKPVKAESGENRRSVLNG